MILTVFATIVLIYIKSKLSVAKTGIVTSNAFLCVGKSKRIKIFLMTIIILTVKRLAIQHQISDVIFNFFIKTCSNDLLELLLR